MIARLQKSTDAVMRACMTLLALALIVAVLLNFANVIARYVFGRAILGADEIEIFIMIWMAFLGAAVVSWRESHLRMDALVSYLPAAVVVFLRRVEILLTTCLAGFVAYHSTVYAAGMYAIGRRSEAAEIPMAIPHAAVVTGFALIAVLGLMRMFGVRNPRRPQEEGTS